MYRLNNKKDDKLNKDLVGNLNGCIDWIIKKRCTRLNNEKDNRLNNKKKDRFNKFINLLNKFVCLTYIKWVGYAARVTREIQSTIVIKNQL